MIKVWYGSKGTGKTKAMLESVNSMVQESKNDVVYIDHNSERMYDLKHQIRYVNASEFSISNCCMFLGFISGIISSDYDLGSIYIDSFTYLTKGDEGNYKEFFEAIEKLSEKYSIDFYISMSVDTIDLPDYVKPYIA